MKTILSILLVGLALTGCSSPARPSAVASSIDHNAASPSPIGGQATTLHQLKPVTTDAAGGSLSLSPSLWDTLSVPQPFSLFSASGLAFSFPVAPNTINYLWNIRPPTSISGTVSLSVTLTETGTPIFHNTDTNADACSPPATVRPFFIANYPKGLNVMANPPATDHSHGLDWADDYARWWANPIAFDLTLGARSATLTIPLDPARWSSVYGLFGNANSATLAGWNQALENVGGIGVTFGGGCFFGHGLYVSDGTATFTIADYRIQ